MTRLLDVAALLLANVAIKSLLVLAIGTAIVFAARRASAATKHLLWTATLAAALAVPLAATTFPAIGLPIRAARTAAVASRGSESQTPTVGTITASPSSANPAVERTTNAATPRLVTTMRALALIWLTGVAALLLRFVIGPFGLRRISRSSSACTDPRILERARTIQSRLRVRRRLAILTAHRESIPVTWGVFSPVVLLPAAAARWDDEQLDAVLIHEIGHVARFDALTQIIAHLATALCWFNPLSWFAKRQAQLEREAACDDLVLAFGATASRYAEQLVAMVQSFGSPARLTLTALSMVQPSDLERRVDAILETGSNRRGITGVAVGLAAALWVGLLPIGALRAEAAALPKAQSAGTTRVFLSPDAATQRGTQRRAVSPQANTAASRAPSPTAPQADVVEPAEAHRTPIVLQGVSPITTLTDVGYTARKQNGEGVFIDGDQIDHRSTSFSNVLRIVPGLRVSPASDGRSMVVSDARAGANGCVNYYVDGTLWESTTPGDIDLAVSPAQLVAVEFYRRDHGPPQFVPRDQPPCATIVAWTKRRITSEGTPPARDTLAVATAGPCSRTPRLDDIRTWAKQRRPAAFADTSAIDMVVGLVFDENCVIQRDTVIQHGELTGAAEINRFFATVFGDTSDFGRGRRGVLFEYEHRRSVLTIAFVMRPAR